MDHIVKDVSCHVNTVANKGAVMDLIELRREIDRVDKQIAALYETRMDLSTQVAVYKAKTGKQILDREREKEKISSLKAMVQESNRDGIEELYEQIMAMSRKLQFQLMPDHDGGMGFREVEELIPGEYQVTYQGAPGAYSQEAMFTYFGQDTANFPVETFLEVMEAVRDGRADFGVLPIENSTAGSVDEIYDLLVEYESIIVGEQVLRVEQCLLTVPGGKREDIRKVFSHPQSLLQSAKFLNEYPWQQISMKNNAFAARKVAEDQDPAQAAIAGEHAAKIYGLSVLERGINHEGSNSTRFIVITKDKVYRREAGKISICFEIPHESGSLYRMLSHFIYNHLNMTKIESRPIEGKNWEYRFFVDFEGNLRDKAVENALKGLSKEAVNLQILGNY
jgi:chorismate mutase/prephenate dehydratase